MSKILPTRPAVAELVAFHLERSEKTQREIAEEVGFENPNVLSMIKTGDTKLPINRVGPLARALGINPAYLLRVVLLEYSPDTWAPIEQLLTEPTLTANERALLKSFRRVTNDADPHAQVIFSEDDRQVISVVCTYPARRHGAY